MSLPTVEVAPPKSPQSTRGAGSRVAVVGAGVAGVVAAYLLDERYEVTLFEKADRLGGHTNTVAIESGPDEGTLIDTGFIVLNDRTYPLFHCFLKALKVPVENSDMSFGVSDGTAGFHYAGTSLNGLFPDRTNLIRPAFWRMLADMRRFCRSSLRHLDEGAIDGCSLGDYIRKENFSAAFVEDYLIPMGGAIWSATEEQVLDYPAAVFVRFFRNHGLLSLKNRPQWQTLSGRGISYLNAFKKVFGGTILLGSSIHGIYRERGGAVIRMSDGQTERFDSVVLACHADESLRLLMDPTPLELRLLTPWRYQKNLAYLHTDSSLLPPRRRAWASWNVRKEGSAGSGKPVCVTYHMNRLQNLQTERDYFVTLNPGTPIDPSKVLREFVYHHPVFDFDSMSTQRSLPELNSQENTFFCGSYFGYGFHEDAVRSAFQVGKRMGVAVP